MAKPKWSWHPKWLSREVVVFSTITVGITIVVWIIGALWVGVLVGLVSTIPAILLLLIAFGYVRRWSWVGVRPPKSQSADEQTYKTLWEWLQLIVVPLALALGLYWLNDQQHHTDTQIAANQRQDAAIATYFDRMSDLLLTGKLKQAQPQRGNVPIALARARTLTTLQQLTDGQRKAYVVHLLYEAALIDAPSIGDPRNRGAIVVLDFADLRGLEWADLQLTRVDLTNTDLRNADFRNADLHGSYFLGAKLQGAKFAGADLDDVNFQGSDITLSQINAAICHDHTVTGDGNIVQGPRTSGCLLAEQRS